MKFALFYFLAAVLIGQTSPPNKTASLSGRVLEAKTGQPLRKATVTLRPLAVNREAGSPIPSPVLTTTDSEGKYLFENLDPGPYSLFAEHAGHIRQNYGARRPLGTGSPLKLKAGEALERIDFLLLKQSIVTGHVLDPDGDPVANVGLQVLRSGFDRGQRKWLLTGGCGVDETGAFRCAGLAPGRYLLKASVRSRAELTGAPPPANRTGQPEQALVPTYYPSAVEQSDAEPITVGPSQELNGIDLKIRKVTVYRVQGVVSFDATRAQGTIRLSLEKTSDGVFGPFGNNSSPLKPDGTFEFDAVQPGSYTLTAYSLQDGPRVLARTDVEVSRENVRNVQLAAREPFTLNGRIHLDVSARQYEEAQGKPAKLDDVRINLSPIGMPFWSEPPSAKEDGTFSIPRATPDRSTISLYGLPANTYIKDIRYGAADALNQPLDLTGGSPDILLDITLALGTANVTGTVADAEGKPVPAATVSLVPDPWNAHRLDLNRSTTTSPDGRFALPNLPPGPYKIYAFTEAEFGSQFDPEILKSGATYAQALTLKPGSSQTVTLKAVPAEDPK